MLPDLEKIILADRKERARLDQAQQEARALLDQTQTKIQALQAKLQTELTLLREKIQEEILHKSEAQAAEVADSAARYITGLRDKQRTQGEEQAAFLLSQVLAE
jgi:hypothetical protein